MKTIKKALALVLTLAIVMSLGIAAFAATTDPTITVVNDSKQVSIVGQTVTAYKLFDLSYDGTNKYTYTPVAELAGYSYTPAGAKKAVTSDTLKEYLESIASDPAAVAAFALDMQKNQTAVLAKLPSKADTASDEKVVLDVKTLGLGYYLVVVQPKNVEGLGAANTPAISVALDTTDYAPEVHVKSEAPALNKTVKEGGAYVDGAVTREVGTNAEFKLETKVPNYNGYTTYKFDIVDTLSAGLKLDETSFKVNINGVAVDDYKLTVSGQTFTLNFGADIMAYMKAHTSFSIGDPIVVTYTAAVTEDGLVTNHQNNSAHIVYSNNPSITGDGSTGTTPDEKVHVYEFGLNIDKVDADATATKLEGAIFALKNDESPAKYYKYNAGKITWEDSAAAATQLYSKDGKLYEYKPATKEVGTVATTFKGLKAGTYHIEELAAPEGYVALGSDIDLVISTTANAADNTLKKATFTFTGAVTGTYDVDSVANFALSLEVGNKAGNKLPSTGGVGTTIFYTLGTVMMVSALVLLITKKKMSVN